jgi:hypothetical protein
VGHGPLITSIGALFISVNRAFANSSFTSESLSFRSRGLRYSPKGKKLARGADFTTALAHDTANLSDCRPKSPGVSLKP